LRNIVKLFLTFFRGEASTLPQIQQSAFETALPGREVSSTRSFSVLADSAMAQLQDIEPGKALVLQAAADCFMASGFAATSIDDVAGQLSATKGRIYHYYRSKADLFFDVHRTGMRINLGSVEPIAVSADTPILKLRTMCERHVYNMLNSINFQRVVMQGVEMHLVGRTSAAEREKLALLMREREQYEQLFQNVLVAGREEGVLHFENPSFASKALLAILNNPVIWYQRREDETADTRQTIIDQFTRFAFNSVSAHSVIPSKAGANNV